MTGGGDGKTRSSSSNRIEAAGVVFGEASAAFSEVEARPLDVAQVEDCRVRGSLATCSEVNQEFGCQAPSSTLCVASKSGSRLQTGSAASSANTTRQDATDSGTLASVNLQKLQRFCCAAEALGSLPYVVIYTHIHISTHGNKSIHTYIRTYIHTYMCLCSFVLILSLSRAFGVRIDPLDLVTAKTAGRCCLRSLNMLDVGKGFGCNAQTSVWCGDLRDCGGSERYGFHDSETRILEPLF